MTKGRVKANAIWIVACRIMQSILTLLIGMLSARYLGPGNYGLISYATSIAAFMVPIVQLGFRSTLVQEIVANPEKEGETLGTALSLSTLSSVLGIGCVTIFVSVVNQSNRDMIIVCSLYSIVLVFQSLEMIQYWFQAKLMAKYTAVVSVIAYMLASCYRLSLLLMHKSVYWFALTNAFDVLLIAVTLLLIYYRKGGQRLSFSWKRGKEMFAKSKYYIISGIMVVMYSHTDRMMLTNMVSEAVNGYYSAAASCATMGNFVFQAVVDSMRPVIFSDKAVEKSRYEKSLSRLYALVIYGAIAYGCVLFFGSGLVVGILYGKSYEASIPVLRILAWNTGFSFVGSVRNIWLLAEDKQGYLWKINTMGAVMNVMLNLALIPRYGAEGAAYATVLSQAITNLLLCGLFKPLRPHLKILVHGMNPRLLLDILK